MVHSVCPAVRARPPSRLTVHLLDGGLAHQRDELRQPSLREDRALGVQRRLVPDVVDDVEPHGAEHPVVRLGGHQVTQAAVPIGVGDEELVGVGEHHGVVRLEQPGRDVADHAQPGRLELPVDERRRPDHRARQAVGGSVRGVVVDHHQALRPTALLGVVPDPAGQHRGLVADHRDGRQPGAAGGRRRGAPPDRQHQSFSQYLPLALGSMTSSWPGRR